MAPESAGLAPALAVPVETKQTMDEKNVDISSQFPKPVSVFPRGHFDRIVNMSGYPVPGFPKATEWKVQDPIGGTPEQYRDVRDQIEHLVMKLILDLRRSSK